MTNETAIKVEGLGKKYRIGSGRKRHNTLRDSLVDGVSRRFRKGGRSNGNGQPSDFWALKDISFNVGRGEVVGIIGRNGAGKSTLLKTLAQITEPSTGSIDIYGRVGSLLEVGTGFHPELSGRENVYLSGSILGMKKAEIDRNFDEIVDFAEVEKFIDTPVKHYSSGMYLRLAFGVAAYLQPEILLVDEVLAVGDAVFQQKCLGKMDDVAKQGRTVLFVSHNMSAVQELCQRGILIEAGRIAFDGKATDCIGDYYKRSQLVDPEDPPASSATTFKVSGIRVNDSVMPAIQTGEGFDVTMHIQAFDVVNPSLLLIVENVTGQQMVHSRITSKDLGLERLDGKYRVKTSVPGLWLTPGVYSIHFKVLVSSPELASRYYSERLMLEVRGEFDGTGRTLLAPDTDWKITTEDLA